MLEYRVLPAGDTALVVEFGDRIDRELNAAVLALDGRRTWRELVEAGAAMGVAPEAGGLARGLADLLADRERQARLGARGREFGEENMTPAHSAQVLAGLLKDLPPGR